MTGKARVVLMTVGHILARNHQGILTNQVYYSQDLDVHGTIKGDSVIAQREREKMWGDPGLCLYQVSHVCFLLANLKHKRGNEGEGRRVWVTPVVSYLGNARLCERGPAWVGAAGSSSDWFAGSSVALEMDAIGSQNLQVQHLTRT